MRIDDSARVIRPITRAAAAVGLGALMVFGGNAAYADPPLDLTGQVTDEASAISGETDAVRLWWESAGVTQVKDRLMITISLSWGEDTPGSFDTTDGDFIHPQLILVEESALKLAT